MPVDRGCVRLPQSPKIAMLPTPQMTPRPNAFYTTTPAASFNPLSTCPGVQASAMTCAMRQIQSQNYCRAAMDQWPYPGTFRPSFCPRSTGFPRPQPVRRSSLALSASSTISSPESMVSDVSTAPSLSSRSSRSSSISSACGLPAPQPQRACLQMQATKRCAGLDQMLASGTLCPARDLTLPTPIEPPAEDIFTCSPASQPFSTAPESFVRGSGAGTEFQDPEALAAALSLRALSGGADSDSSFRQRKRERPTSVIDPDGILQRAVRAELRAPASCAGDGAVAPDAREASSIMLPYRSAEGDDGDRRPRTAIKTEAAPHVSIRGLSGSRDGQRKRIRCGQEMQRPGAEWAASDEWQRLVMRTQVL